MSSKIIVEDYSTLVLPPLPPCVDDGLWGYDDKILQYMGQLVHNKFNGQKVDVVSCASVSAFIQLILDKMVNEKHPQCMMFQHGFNVAPHPNTRTFDFQIPRFPHTCDCCVFLGHHDDPRMNHDMFFCLNENVTMARFGKHPAKLVSGDMLALTIPALAHARRAAAERGLFL